MDKVEGFSQPGNFLELNNSLLLLWLLLFSCWVVSDSLGPRGLQHTRLPCPSLLAQSHVHWVADAIQPSHPPLSPSAPAFNLSQHQGLFQWVSSSHPVAKGLEFQLEHQSFQWIFRVDLLAPWWNFESENPKLSLEKAILRWFACPAYFSWWAQRLNWEIECTDTLTHSWCRKGLSVAHATQEFQSPWIYLVEGRNETTKPTVAEGSVWLLNAEGAIILSVCVSRYQKWNVRVGRGRDLHFLFFIIETCFFFFHWESISP